MIIDNDTSEKFPIFEIPLDSSEASEVMGTKSKFWFLHPVMGRCLFKKVRAQSDVGEDWSEKIAAELCSLIKLPHADCELAIFNGERGVISSSFVPENGSIVHGNEILARILLEYPREVTNPSQHTLENISISFNLFDVNLPLDWIPLGGISTAMDTFTGYLLLDAWIGNSDRHHENWAFIDLDKKMYLAPTYDHASSLGRNESDENRKARLNTRDAGFSVRAYANKCRSCLYAKIGDRKPISPFEAFCDAAKFNPQAAKIWLDSLVTVSAEDTQSLFERIGSDRISSIAINFAQAILEVNKNKLLEFRESLL